MILAAPTALMTAEEFALLPDAERYELLDGQLVEREMSNTTTVIGGRIHQRFGNWCDAGHRGFVLPDGATYRLVRGKLGRVRKPDVSWFSQERWSPKLLASTDIEIAPDLMVEVLSPNDNAYDIGLKVDEFFRAGTKEAWIVHPQVAQLERRFASGEARWHAADQPLDGAPMLPGFTLKLADVLAGLA